MATYDKNKDYTALINQAVKNGDLYAAANYEQSLNAKIAGRVYPTRRGTITAIISTQILWRAATTRTPTIPRLLQKHHPMV